MSTTITKAAPIKILIVDDNAQMRDLTRIYLDQWAEEIRECDDGAEALDVYAHFQPDLVLMDWEMKQTDGLTATREIIRSFPDAYILIFTQHNYPELRAAARAAGASGYVLKDNLLDLSKIVAAL